MWRWHARARATRGWTTARGTRDARTVARAKSTRARRAGDRPPGAPATTIEPAELMGVREDHALEQFFYDDETLARLMRLAKTHERPAFVCNPSLASAWEREVGTPYVLLDCDARWKAKLRGFRRFDLRAPFVVRFDYDVVFIDPPFANVSPKEVRRALTLIAGTEAQRRAPVYIAFNGEREAELNEAFDGELQRVFGRALGYKSVKPEMQSKIQLFGPKV